MKIQTADGVVIGEDLPITVYLVENCIVKEVSAIEVRGGFTRDEFGENLPSRSLTIQRGQNENRLIVTSKSQAAMGNVYADEVRAHEAAISMLQQSQLERLREAIKSHAAAVARAIHKAQN